VDTALIVVTLVSLATALALALTVRKLKESDQLRSDARVAALVAAADALPIHTEERRPVRAAASDGTWSSIAGEWQWNPEPARSTASPRPNFDLAPEKPTASSFRTETQHQGRPEPETASPEPLFGTVRRETPASGRFAFAAALALVVALGGAMVVFSTSGHAKVSASTAHPAQSNPLELVSLGHARDAGSLTIKGVVRNPANGAKLEGLTAVVSLIDDHGGLISTKDVPLDYRALGPGEEAPFKVTIPDPGSVARYRVSFRAGTDVVPHVDRRTDTKLASAL